ncbi:MAG TPA: hypothetical protein VF620_05445 [Allosphingosinicella sp.]|jgi:hypothetical protein
MSTLGGTLAGLLMLGQQEMIVVTTGPHPEISPKYHQTDYESACGSHVFRVRFRNGPEENGRIDHLLVDGRPVRDGAETLDIRAARRWIERILIKHCDSAPSRSIFRGVIEFSEGESRMLAMRWALAFRLIREGEDWRIVVD